MFRTEPPIFLRLDQMIRDAHVTLAPGSTVRLRCRAGGKPRPEVLWFKDGKMIADEEAEALRHGEGRWMLRLTRVKVEDSGKYSCRTFNKAGTINFTYDVNVVGWSRYEMTRTMIMMTTTLMIKIMTTMIMTTMTTMMAPHQ